MPLRMEMICLPQRDIRSSRISVDSSPFWGFKRRTLLKSAASNVNFSDAVWIAKQSKHSIKSEEIRWDMIMTPPLISVEQPWWIAELVAAKFSDSGELGDSASWSSSFKEKSNEREKYMVLEHINVPKFPQSIKLTEVELPFLIHPFSDPNIS